jgi:hypothetical protein
MKIDEIGDCGVCAGLTRRGGFFESSGRDRTTGRTYHDNFVCEECQREAAQLAEFNTTLDRHRQRKVA